MILNWQPLTVNGNICGLEARLPRLHFFFGTRFTKKDDLQNLFPHYKFSFLKQVHGAQVVQANPHDTLQADAHFTSQLNVALVVQTADCLPILLAGSEQIFAIHAGWRGVAQNIVGACKSQFKGPPLIAAVGPHIQQKSFEVGLDVASQLETLLPAAVSNHPSPEKKWIDLNLITAKQLKETCGTEVKIDFLPHDTVTDPLFHSFRRGKQTPDRQYSFVVITDHSS